MGKRVYISNKCKYRNEEIKRLVWEKNPYVNGFSDDAPNAGMSCFEVQEFASSIWKPTGVSMENIEISHGFLSKDPKPEVYYLPKDINSLSGSLVFDATACTAFKNYKDVNLIGIINSMFDGKKFFLKSRRVEYKDYEDFSSDDFETIYVDSIFEYCDVISSCGSFVSLMSGGHSLSQALRLKNTYCILPKALYDIHYERGLFINDSVVSYIKF